ncbi:flagellar hook-associated protein 3 FlgL [Gemmobacter aquatilis]|uniref:Flagellar hook-associated protein 3 FlgL n=1 Tax=Gemmobacter aquatilis TaxID=933059 RepID=A0A1H7YSR6_9RHOB|nr:flagellin [Gemmobacter aquatilis]SEM49025.1 flagellar hook-associated protein 3 FlgL [Gemmobacter aquatilis]
MSMISLGDLAQSFLLRRSMGAVKSSIATLSQEVTTGRAADTARHLRGTLGPLAALDRSLSQLSAYARTTTDMQVRASATQTALGTLATQADALSTDLLAVSAGQTGTLTALGNRAEQGFLSAVAALNTSIGGSALFSGMAVDQPPLIAGEALLSRIVAVTNGASTARDAANALEVWFEDPAGFATEAWRGAAAGGGVPIAAGETARLDVTALDPELRETLKGLALGALINRSDQTSPDARAAFAGFAGEGLLAARSGLATLQGRVARVEGQIAEAQSRNSSESSALQIARTSMVAVDDYDAATRLSDAETRLETLYAVTARLSSLSLTEYLR